MVEFIFFIGLGRYLKQLVLDLVTTRECMSHITFVGSVIFSHGFLDVGRRQIVWEFYFRLRAVPLTLRTD